MKKRKIKRERKRRSRRWKKTSWEESVVHLKFVKIVVRAAATASVEIVSSTPQAISMDFALHD